MRSKIFYVLASIALAPCAYSQVGIGTIDPDNSAQLEVKATDRGVLIPRIPLKSITQQLSASENAKSLLIFNSKEFQDPNDSATYPEGYYYWDGERWVYLLKGADLASALGNITLEGDVTGPLSDTKVGNLINKPVDNNANPETNQVLVFKDGKWTPSKINSTSLEGQDLTSADESIEVTDGTGATLVNTNIRVADGGITTDKIKAGTDGQVLATDNQGKVIWKNLTETTVDNLTGGKDLTAGDNSIVITDGTGATLVNTNVKVKDGGITTEKLADNSVTTTKIRNGSIQGDDLNLSSVNLSGDVTGSLDNTKVGKLQGVDISANTPDSDQVLTFKNGEWTPAKVGVNSLESNAVNEGKVLVTNPDGTVEWKNVNSDNIDGKDLTLGAGLEHTAGELAGSLLKEVTIEISNKGITKDKLADNSVDSSKIEDDTVTGADIKDGSITGADLAPGTVTADKIDGKNLIAEDTSIEVTDGTGATLVDAKVKVADGGITESKLGAGSVTNDKLGDNAVTTDKIQDGTITGDDLAANTITSANIDGKNLIAEDTSIEVTDGTGATLVDAKVKVADGGITESKLGAGAVTNDKLGDNAVTTDKIQDGTITGDDLAANTITSANIDGKNLIAEDTSIEVTDGTGATLVDAKVKVADGGITESKLGAGAVTNDKLGSDAVTTDKIKDGTITAADIKDGSITAADIDGKTLTLEDGLEKTGGDLTGALLKDATIGIKAGGITNDKLGDNAVTTNKIANGTIKGEDLAPNTIKSDNIQGKDGGNGEVLVTKADGTTEWKKLSGDNINGEALTVTNGIEITDGEQGAATALLKAVKLGIATGGVTNEMLAGDISDDKLAGGIDGAKIANETILPSKIKNKGNLTVNDGLELADTDSGTGALLRNVTIKLSDKGINPGKIMPGAKDQVLVTKEVNGDTVTQWETPEATTADNITNGHNLQADANGGITVTEGDGVLLKKDASIKITAGGVTNDKLGTGAVTKDKLGANAVDSSKIEDGTITDADLANDAVTVEKIKGEAANSGKVLVTGTDGSVSWSDLSGENIENESIPVGKIKDKKSLTTKDGIKVEVGGEGNVASDALLKDVTIGIADGGIDGSKLKDGTVASVKLAGGIEASQLKGSQEDGQILTTDGQGNVSWKDPKVIDASTIDNAGDLTSTDNTINITSTSNNGADALLKDVNIELADNAVTSSKIKNSTIKGEDLEDNAITAGKIATDAVTADNIADKGELSSNGTITVKKGADALLKDVEIEITAGAQDQVLTTDAQGAIAWKKIEGKNLAPNTITKDQIKDNAITADKIAVKGKLTAEDGIEIKNGEDNGTDALLKDVTIKLAKGGIDPAKIKPGDANQVLVTKEGQDGEKITEWKSVEATTADDITQGKSLVTSDGIVVRTDNNGETDNAAAALLKKVTIGIADKGITFSKISGEGGTKGQVLTSKEDGTTEWKNLSGENIENETITSDKIKGKGELTSKNSTIIITEDGTSGDGTKSLLKNVNIELADNAVNPGKLEVADGTPGDGKVLSTNNEGKFVWKEPTAKASNITGGQPLNEGHGILVAGKDKATALLKAVELAVKANEEAGITVSEAGVAIKKGDGIDFAGNGEVIVKANKGIKVDAEGVAIDTGDGLEFDTTGTEARVKVKAKNGISVNGADGVKLGGELTEPTTIKTDNTNALVVTSKNDSETNTIRFENLPAKTEGDTGYNFVTVGADGQLKKGSLKPGDITGAGDLKAEGGIEIKQETTTESTIQNALLKNVTIGIKDQGITVSKLKNEVGDAGKVLTAGNNGTVTWETPTVPTAETITGGQPLTSPKGTIQISDKGSKALLKDVTIDIKPGTSGQVLITDENNQVSWGPNPAPTGQPLIASNESGLNVTGNGDATKALLQELALSVKPNENAGIKVTSDGVGVNKGKGLDFEGKAVIVKAHNGISVSQDGVAVKPDQNAGITVSNDGVAINKGDGLKFADDTAGKKLAVRAKDNGGITVSDTGVAVKAENGLKVDDQNDKGVILGGTLTEKTTITTDTTNALIIKADTANNNTIKFENLPTVADGDNYTLLAVNDTDGQLKKRELKGSDIKTASDLKAEDGIRISLDGAEENAGTIANALLKDVTIGIKDQGITASKLKNETGKQGEVLTANADGTVTWQPVDAAPEAHDLTAGEGLMFPPGGEDGTDAVLKEITLKVKADTTKGITVTQNEGVAINNGDGIMFEAGKVKVKAGKGIKVTDTGGVELKAYNGLTVDTTEGEANQGVRLGGELTEAETAIITAENKALVVKSNDPDMNTIKFENLPTAADDEDYNLVTVNSDGQLKKGELAPYSDQEKYTGRKWTFGGTTAKVYQQTVEVNFNNSTKADITLPQKGGTIINVTMISKNDPTKIYSSVKIKDDGGQKKIYANTGAMYWTLTGDYYVILEYFR